MSRISDLIAKLCPGGVPFKELNEVFTTRGGYTPSKADVTAWTDGTVPWFRMEDIRENGQVLSDSLQHIAASAVKGGRLFAANSIIVATSATIGEHALITVPHLSNQRFTSLTLKPAYADRLDMKFVFYYCFVLDDWCRNNTTTSSFASVDMAGFKKFKFPIPPLSVQLEIVAILDRFKTLEATLEAELSARRRQYEHYRDSLLSFTETPPRLVRWVPLTDLGKWFGGMTPSKARADYWTDGDIPWLASMDVSATSSGHIGSAEIRGRVTADALRLTPVRTVTAPSVAVVMRSNILRRRLPIGFVTVEMTVNQDIRALAPHDGIDAEYVYQALQARADSLRDACVRTDGSMAAVDTAKFFATEIPVPALEEQQGVVARLRAFDDLVNDMSIGLPAEIAARRLQYEYYRDQLLTFEELAA